MFYGLCLKRLQDGRIEASCRDIPECVWTEDSEDEAIASAGQMLPGTMELFYRKKRRAIPLPSPVEKGEVLVFVPVRIQAKILFWNFLVENRYRVSDVAKQLSISQTQAQRYVDLTKDGASMDAIESAMENFGIRLSLSADLRVKNDN